MTSRSRRAAYAAVPLTALVALTACSEEPREPARPSGATSSPSLAPVPPDDEATTTRTAGPVTDGEATTSPTTAAPSPTAASVEVLATGFEVPWGLTVLDNGTVVVAERDTAQIWWVPPGGEPVPVGEVPGVVPDGEGGLLGIAVPPDGDGATFWAYYTAESDNRVARVTFTSGSRTGDPEVAVVLDGIPKAGNHNGGRIAFGPDGFLYVSTGDASDSGLSQDPESLAGKILRITPEGEPAPDNPDPGSPVWSLGHRNVQGLAWDGDGRLWATEFGQNDLDEVNLIEPGNNYGWPEVEGTGGGPEFTEPVVTWPTSEASPSGLAVGPDGALYVAALRGESLWRVPLDGPEAGEPERLLQGEYGRLRSVVTGPDDALYVLNNNTFRGEPSPEDDRLLRILAPDLLTP